MAILKSEEQQVFDPAAVRRGYFVFCRHKSWDKGVNGLAASVAEKELLVQFLPEIRNVTNHCRIRAEEVAAGEWELRVSADLKGTEEAGSIGTV